MAVLLDAGFSCRELERRIRRIGADVRKLAAIVLTHEHEDHVRGAARLCERWNLPIYATEGTLQGWPEAERVAKRLVPVSSSGSFEVAGRWRFEPFLVPHDAREPVGFVVEHRSGKRLGLAADLGYLGHLAGERLRDVDGLLLEFNHDLDLLRNGPYPWPLKQRVAGRFGHLANHDAALGLERVVSDRLRWVVAYHLSRVNNRPALVEALLWEVLERCGLCCEVVIADQFEPSTWLEVIS